jgi:hypothetical protein
MARGRSLLKFLLIFLLIKLRLPRLLITRMRPFAIGAVVMRGYLFFLCLCLFGLIHFHFSIQFLIDPFRFNILFLFSIPLPGPTVNQRHYPFNLHRIMFNGTPSNCHALQRFASMARSRSLL